MGKRQENMRLVLNFRVDTLSGISQDLLKEDQALGTWSALLKGAGP